MITASYMTFRLNFREEFQCSFSSANYGVDLSVQPIDAPEYISAGGHHRVKSVDESYEYWLPLTSHRQYIEGL